MRFYLLTLCRRMPIYYYICELIYKYRNKLIYKQMTNIYGSRKEPMYQVVSYLSKSEKAKLKTHCAVNNITMSTFMKDLILKELKQNEN